MPSSSKIRSSRGCWTCRLRRKKCDERRPVCEVCGSLQITCHYSDEKPEWMDGGELEKRKADEFKVMVKSKASERRERKWSLNSNRPDPVEDTAMQHGSDPIPTPAPASAVNDGLSYSMASAMVLDSSSSGTDHDGSSDSPHTAGSTTSSYEPSTTPPEMARYWPGYEEGDPRSTSFPMTQLESEMNFVMVYLDFVAPFLFPFYRPPLLEASRGWLLITLMKNKALFHAALSLATYFFSVVLDAAEQVSGGHEPCKEANWDELQTHQKLAIDQLKRDMTNLEQSSVGGGAPLMKGIYVLESMIQLLEYQVAIANTENWPVHLDAASSLFHQLITTHHSNPDSPWNSLLVPMGTRQLQVTFAQRKHPWSADHAAFRFYTARLLWTDIISATARRERPKLEQYHAEILHGEPPLLCLGEFVGCQNWVALAIADTAALAAWKHEEFEQRRKAFLASGMAANRGHESLGSRCSEMRRIREELLLRASAIETRIQRGLDELEAELPLDDILKGEGRARDLFDPSAQPPHMSVTGSNIDLCYQPNDTRGRGGTPSSFGRTGPAVALHTRIWAHAALTYLAVTTSGFVDPPSSSPLPTVTPFTMVRMMMGSSRPVNGSAAKLAGSAGAVIEEHVSAILSLLQALPNALGIRTLVWPMTVAGCSLSASRASDRDQLLALIDGMGEMRVFGTVNEARNLMLRVWQLRDSGNWGNESSQQSHSEDSEYHDPAGLDNHSSEDLDFARCFSALGHHSLLV